VMDSLKPGGRCGIVMDEGVLFRTNETAFVQTKRKLLNECNLWLIVSLPPKVFMNAGAASKTNLLFFNKGGPTKEIWYYDLSDINITKKQPLTAEQFEEFFQLLNAEFGMRNKDSPQSTIKIPQSSWRSWRVPIEEIEAKNYDLKAVNPNRKNREDSRTPDELIAIIESQAVEITTAVQILRNKGI